MFRYGLAAVMLAGFATPALADFYVVRDQGRCYVQELTDSQRAEIELRVLIISRWKTKDDAEIALNQTSICDDL